MSDGNRMYPILPNAIAVENDKLYCVDKLSCQIIVFALDEKSVEHLIKLPEDVTFADESRSMIFVYRETILFLPNNENVLYLCDVGETSWKLVQLSDNRNKGFYLYSHGKIINGFLHIFPFTGRNYIRFNIEERRVDYVCDFFERLKTHFSEDFMSVNAPTWIDEGRIAGCISVNNAAFIASVPDFDMDIKRFKKDGCIISTAAAVRASLILCDRNNRALYKVGINSYEIEKEYCLKNNKFRITSINKALFVLEMIDIGEFCILNEDFEVLYHNTDAAAVGDTLSDAWGIVSYGDSKGFYYNKFSRKIYIVHESGVVEENNIFSELDMKSLTGGADIGGRLFKEDSFFGLSDYVKVITDK